MEGKKDNNFCSTEKEPQKAVQVYAGAGTGEIILPDEYFPEDGFTGAVHSFECDGSIVKDIPMVRILLLDGGERVAIAAMEIAQTPADLIAAVKSVISKTCGAAEDNIWVHTTHQFGFMHRPKEAEKADMFNKAVISAVHQAADEARSTFRAAKWGAGTGKCNISANKNILPPKGVSGGPYYGPGSTGETNETLTVIKFADLHTGDEIGFFLSYGTKPSVLCTTGKNENTRELNSEVTGQACKRVEKRFCAPCIFCMPGAGDQYPRETAMYYGFNERGEWNVIDIGFEKGIKIVDRLSDRMGEDAINVAMGICCDKTTAPTAVSWTSFRYPNKTEDAQIEVPIDVIRFGDVAFVGFKQEMDVRTEFEIWERSPFKTTLLVSFLNGDGKYLGHDEAYDYNNGIGTWETNRSPFARGAAEKFVCVAEKLLCDIKDGVVHNEAREKVAAQANNGMSAVNGEIDFAGRKWVVLTKQENRILVMSRNVVVRKAFNEKNINICWADSDIRKWLNTSYLNSFSEDDRKRITKSRLINPANPKYGISGGPDTIDSIFLLNILEAESYLGGFKELLMAEDDNEKAAWWYLRTPGEAGNVAATVSADGHIDYHGAAENAADGSGGIRPCFWLSLGNK